MKGLLRLVAIFAIPFTIISFSGPSSADGESAFILQIAPSQNAGLPGSATFKTGAPIFLVLTLKNNSKHVLHFGLTNPALNYRPTVLDSTGKPVPETEYFRKIKEPLKPGDLVITGRNILVTLKPGETREDTMELSFLFELTQSGSYTVQLERDMPPELGPGSVKSNVLTISVVDAKPDDQLGKLIIRDPAEYDAYMKAVQTPNPADKAQLLEWFLRRYPNTVMKTESLKGLLGAYQLIKNEEEVVRTAQRLVEVDPSDLPALALLTYTYRSCAARNGVNAKECLNNAVKYAERGLRALQDSHAETPGMSAEDFDRTQQLRQLFEESVRLKESKSNRTN